MLVSGSDFLHTAEVHQISIERIKTRAASFMNTRQLFETCTAHTIVFKGSAKKLLEKGDLMDHILLCTMDMLFLILSW